MVAETHSAYDGLTVEIIVDFVVNVVSQLDVVSDEAAAVPLAACGVETMFDLLELVELIGEEYGERTLTGFDVDTLEFGPLERSTVGELVEALYPELSDRG